MSDPVKHLDHQWRYIVANHYDESLEAWRSVEPEEYETEEEYMTLLINRAGVLIDEARS